jgi:hypothetical protein
MPKFKVVAVYSTYCTAEIDAADSFEAYDIAKEMDGDAFTPSHENYDWHINEVTEVK